MAEKETPVESSRGSRFSVALSSGGKIKVGDLLICKYWFTKPVFVVRWIGMEGFIVQALNGQIEDMDIAHESTKFDGAKAANVLLKDVSCDRVRTGTYAMTKIAIRIGNNEMPRGSLIALHERRRVDVMSSRFWVSDVHLRDDLLMKVEEDFVPFAFRIRDPERRFMAYYNNIWHRPRIPQLSYCLRDPEDSRQPPQVVDAQISGFNDGYVRITVDRREEDQTIDNVYLRQVPAWLSNRVNEMKKAKLQENQTVTITDLRLCACLKAVVTFPWERRESVIVQMQSVLRLGTLPRPFYPYAKLLGDPDRLLAVPLTETRENRHDWPKQLKFIVNDKQFQLRIDGNTRVEDVMTSLGEQGVRGDIVGLTHSASGICLLQKNDDGKLSGTENVVSQSSEIQEGDEFKVKLSSDGRQWPQRFEFRVEGDDKSYLLPLCGEHSVGDVLQLLKLCGVDGRVVRLYHVASGKDLYRIAGGGTGSSLNEGEEETMDNLLPNIEEGKQIHVILAEAGPGMGQAQRWSSSGMEVQSSSEDTAMHRLHFKIQNRRAFVNYYKTYTLKDVMTALGVDYQDENLSDIRVKSKSLYKKIKGSDIMTKTLEDFNLQPADYIELVYVDGETDEPFHVQVFGISGSPHKMTLGKDQAFTNFDLKEKIRALENGTNFDVNKCLLFEYQTMRTNYDGGTNEVITFCRPMYDIDRPPMNRCSGETDYLCLWKNCEYVDLKRRVVVDDEYWRWPWGDLKNKYWLNGIRLFGDGKSYFFVELLDGDWVEVDSGQIIPKEINFSTDELLEQFSKKSDRQLSLFISFLGKENAPPIRIPQRKRMLKLHRRLKESDLSDYFLMVEEKERFQHLMKYAVVEGFWIKCLPNAAEKMTKKCQNAQKVK